MSNQNQERISIGRDESLSQIVAKITAQEASKDIYLEVEDDSVLRHYINTKLLLSRFPGKKLIFVSGDPVLKKIAEGLGIKFFFRNENIEFEEKFTKAHVLRYNFTFFEFLLYEVHKLWSKLVFVFQKRSAVYKSAMFKKDSHVLLLMVGLVMSFSLLGFIFYFTVSKTYVYISPALSVKTSSRNLIFTAGDGADIVDKKNMVQVKAFALRTTSDYGSEISSLDFTSAKAAHGAVEVLNELTTEQTFRPNTRFVTEEGYVYRSTAWIKIPGARSASGQIVPGRIEVELQADPYDTAGNVIGKKGNLAKGKLLVAPGLKFNRDKVYARVLKGFTEGTDPQYHVITKPELEKLTSITLEKVKNKALLDLKEKIRTQNLSDNRVYEILPVDESIQYMSGSTEVLNGQKVGDRAEYIYIRASVSIQAYTYDKDAALFYLKTVLNETLLSGTEKLIAIQPDTLRVSSVLSRSDNPFYMKATTDLDATIAYNFEDSTNNLTKKLKNLIVSMGEKDATSILLNDPNVQSVKLQFMPFWVSRVSNNPDNIEFMIRK